MAACWKHDISRNEGEELLTLWRQREVANMCGMCVTSTRAKQYWLLLAVRPSSGVHSLLPPVELSRSSSVGLLGLLTNDENLKFFSLSFAFYVSFFFIALCFHDCLRNVSQMFVFKHHLRLYLKGTTKCG